MILNRLKVSQKNVKKIKITNAVNQAKLKMIVNMSHVIC